MTFKDFLKEYSKVEYTGGGSPGSVMDMIKKKGDKVGEYDGYTAKGYKDIKYWDGEVFSYSEKEDTYISLGTKKEVLNKLKKGTLKKGISIDVDKLTQVK